MKSDFLGSHWLLDGGEMCLLKSYSRRSSGVDENLTSYIKLNSS